jgi:hypothetical protein
VHAASPGAPPTAAAQGEAETTGVRSAGGDGDATGGRDWAALAEAANLLYEEGVALEADEPARASESFARAARGFRRVIDEGGFASAELYYNLGNAEARRGRLGRAVEAYLQAERLAPRDAEIDRNLRIVRARVETRVEGADAGVTEARGAAGTLLAPVVYVHRSVPTGAKLWVFIAAAWVFWLVLGVRLVCVAGKRPAWPARRLAALPFVVALLTSASVAAELVVPPSEIAVIVDEPHTARTGPGDGYGRAFTEALSPGVEMLVRERRGGWLLGRLADGSSAWVREGAVAVVEVD